MNWIRVTHKTRCPVCQKPDWCRIGEIFVHCMRVQSNNPSKCEIGGWLHPIGAEAKALPRKPEQPRPTIDADKLMRGWWNHTTRAMVAALAGSLGVSEDALVALKCAYAPDYQAWAFPMRDGSGSVCGIRLRWDNGQKKAVTGSREGIFLSQLPTQSEAWLPEGPTDMAALMTLGKYAIGRPTCMGGVAHLAATCARMNIRRAVIVSDNDEDKERPNGDKWNPGLDGAKRLAEEIGIPCCLVILPTKDSRDFLAAGGTSELLDSFTQSVVWHQPKGKRFTEILPSILHTSKNVSRTISESTP